jgi:hypothetical protein
MATVVFSFFDSLPQDLFRYIFKYLTLDTLVKLEKVFLQNQQLAAHFASSLSGSVIADDFDPYEEQKYEWVREHGILLQHLRIDVPTRENFELLTRSRATLESLHLSNSYGEPCNSDMNSLLHIGNMPLLTYLSIESCDYLDCDITSQFLKLQPQLEFLRISGMDHLSADLLTVLTSFCPNIKHLILADSEWVTDETIPLLTQGCRQLKSLDIKSAEIRNDSTIRLLITSFPSLCSLETHYDNFSDEVKLLILRQIIFRAILSEDPDSQCMGLKSFQDNVDLLCKLPSLFFSSLLASDSSPQITPRS